MFFIRSFVLATKDNNYFCGTEPFAPTGWRKRYAKIRQEMKTDAKLLARVREMEERYDRLRRVQTSLEDALAAFSRVQPDLEALKEYMDSGQWKADFERDEAGEIPAGVKRGVLSEDGLYDLLQQVQEILL